MRVSKPFNSRGFSLVEMLVAISILLLLSGLTVSGIRALKNHQVLDQAAARFAMLVELAQGMALSENERVYLVIADHGAKPDGVPMRAYTFIKNLSDPELLHHWQFLPKDVYFAEDREGADVDLIMTDPIAVLENAFPNQAQGSRVEGQIRVILEMTTESRLLSGAGRDPQAASILLNRGNWISDAALNYRFISEMDADEDAPFDQFRINFRPLSGFVRVEEVLP
jgi:prepilin-type N-terminal cleavage/methylation domain-containing protein